MKSIPRFISLTRLALAGSAAVLLTPSLYAANATWGNTGTNFNAEASWTEGAMPTASGTAIFSGASVINPDVTAPLSLAQLYFNSDASGYNISSSNGSAITLGDTGNTTAILAINPGGSAVTANIISADLILTAGTKAVNMAFLETATAGNSSGLSLTGDISETGGAAALSLGRLASPGGIPYKSSGVATFTISGNNTFSGGVILGAPGGVLNLGSATALGTGTLSITTTSGAYVNNITGSPLTISNALLLAGNALNSNGGDITFNGPVTLSYSGIVSVGAGSGQTITFAGDIGEASAGRRIATSGSVILSGANTYSGGTVISGGTLSVSNIGSSADASSNLGAGTGVVSLGQVSSAKGGQAFENTLMYTGVGETTDRTVELNYRATSWIVNNGSGSLTFTSDLTNHFAETSQLATGGTYSSVLGLGGNYRGISELSGNIIDDDDNFSIRKEGVGIWVLSGSNRYIGTTTVNGGTLVFDMKNSRTYTPGSNILPNNGGTVSGGGNLVLGGGEFKVVGQSTGDTSVAMNRSGLTLTAYTGSKLTIDANGGNSTTLDFGSTSWTRGARSTLSIDMSSTKGGAQRLVAPGTTFAATTQVNSAPVLGWATVTDSTGTGFAINVDGYIVRYTAADTLVANADTSSRNYKYTDGGTLNMTGATHRIKSLSIDTDNGDTTIDLGGATNYMTFNGLLTTGSHDVTFQNGVVGGASENIFHTVGSGDVIINATLGSGAGQLTKAGSGTLVLNGTGGYTGTTTINEGTVRFAQKAALYNGNTVNWTSSNIRVQQDATLALNVGGATEFSASDVSTLLAMTSGSTAGFKGGSYLGLDTTSGDFTYNNAIADSYAKSRLGLKKLGANALTLTGANTYTGDTIVAKGSLNVNGSLASGLVVAASGAKLNVNGSITGSVQIDGDLGGSGSIAGATLINGRFAPGNSIGTLSTGDLTFGADSVFDIELGVSSGVAVSDRANVTGTVNILDGAALNLTLSIGTVQTGDLFFLINNDGTDVVTGSFILSSALGGTALTDGSQFSWNDKIWKISYHADAGSSSFINGNDVALMVVPEPSTWALLTGGLGMLVAMQGMRRRAKVS